MAGLTNSIQNNALTALMGAAPRGVVNAIKDASARTGVDFAYLLQQAKAESSFKPDAKAKTSSASGLYQFIESTWLSMVEKHGAKHGIETQGKSRSELLALRNDPEKASVMAAEFAGENARFLKQNWGGEVGGTEMYFAHFLGAGQAASFLKAKDENPMQAASTLFPAAAKANRGVFYDQATGRAKSLDEVYAFFDRKFGIDDTGPAQAPATQLAENAVKTDAIEVEPLVSLFEQPAETPRSVVYNPQKPAVAMNSYARPASFGSLGTFDNLVANPLEILLLSQMDSPLKDEKKSVL